MHCVKFGWNWPCDYFNFVNVFLLFRDYLPLEKGKTLHLKKNQNLIFLHPRMICDKFGWNWSSGSWEEDLFFNLVNVILQFRHNLPLEKGRGPLFEKKKQT